MPLDDILIAIEKQGAATVTTILDEARCKAKGIVEDAKQKAANERESILAEIESKTARIRSSQISATRQDARKQLQLALESITKEAIDCARSEVTHLRNNSFYPVFLRTCILEVTEGMKEDFEILVDPADEQLVNKLTSDLRLKTIRIVPELNCSGGLIARSLDGKIIIRNTLESRLEEAARRHFSDITKIMLTAHDLNVEEHRWMADLSMAMRV